MELSHYGIFLNCVAIPMMIFLVCKLYVFLHRMIYFTSEMNSLTPCQPKKKTVFVRLIKYINAMNIRHHNVDIMPNTLLFKRRYCKLDVAVHFPQKTYLIQVSETSKV